MVAAVLPSRGFKTCFLHVQFHMVRCTLEHSRSQFLNSSLTSNIVHLVTYINNHALTLVCKLLSLLKIGFTSVAIFSSRTYFSYIVNYSFVRFEVLTVVVVKSTIFWTIMPCSLLKVNRRFGGTSFYHLLSSSYFVRLILRSGS
jgi:hypothetical protein